MRHCRIFVAVAAVVACGEAAVVNDAPAVAPSITAPSTVDAPAVDEVVAEESVAAPICAAEIDREPVSGKRLASWEALYIALMGGEVDEEMAVKGTKAAQAALGFDARRKRDPLWVLSYLPVSDMNGRSDVLVGPAKGGGLVHYGQLGEADPGACQTSGTLGVTPVGALLHARWVEVERGWTAIPKARRDPNCDSESDQCELECSDLVGRVDDYVIDPAAARRLLLVRRTNKSWRRPEKFLGASIEAAMIEAELPVHVEVGETGVTLHGGGCDEMVAIRRP